MKKKSASSTKVTINLLCFLCLVPFVLTGEIKRVNNMESTGTVDFATFDRYIQERMRSARIPGLAVVVVRGNETVFKKGYGTANPAGQAVTPQTPFIIGSLSKSFTALAVMQLVETGKVNLDAPVQQYIPWFSVADPVVSEQITIRQLLYQSSGIPEPPGQRSLASTDISEEALEREVRSYHDVQLTFKPGDRMQYSNANYNTIGLVVQYVSGMSYEDYIRQNIFLPLQMHQSYASETAAATDGLAVGYRSWFGLPVAAPGLPYPRGSIPSGYLISSAEDMGHYLVAMLNDGWYLDQQVISMAGLTTLFSPSDAQPVPYMYKAVGCNNKPGARYAMGWWHVEVGGVPVICHTGDTANFHTEMVLVPQEKTGVVILMNLGSKLMSEDVHGLITGVVDILADRPFVREPVDIFSRVLFFIMMVVFGLELFLNIRLVFHWVTGMQNAQPRIAAASVNTRKIIFPLLFSLLGAGILLVVVPLWCIKIPMKVILLMQPDFAWMMIVTAGLILTRGLMQSAINFHKQSIQAKAM